MMESIEPYSIYEAKEKKFPSFLNGDFMAVFVVLGMAISEDKKIF